MDPEALRRFLDHVGRDSFVDYLDPVDESIERALARRLAWARSSCEDPAHAEEAGFLLEHEEDLPGLLLLVPKGMFDEISGQWPIVLDTDDALPATPQPEEEFAKGDPFNPDELGTNLTLMADITNPPAPERVAGPPADFTKGEAQNPDATWAAAIAAMEPTVDEPKAPPPPLVAQPTAPPAARRDEAAPAPLAARPTPPPAPSRKPAPPAGRSPALPLVFGLGSVALAAFLGLGLLPRVLAPAAPTAADADPPGAPSGVVVIETEPAPPVRSEPAKPPESTEPAATAAATADPPPRRERRAREVASSVPLTAAEPSPAPEPVDLPPTPKVAPVLLNGSWTGAISGSGFDLRVRADADGRLTGTGQLQTPAGPRQVALQGQLDPATGALTLADRTETLVLHGTYEADRIRGRVVRAPVEGEPSWRLVRP